jgi:hypothetical protein
MMGQFLVIDANATAIEREELPNGDFLVSNYPNPTTDWTTISYSLEQHSRVRITIYDSLGREVKTIFDGFRSAGENESVWKAGGVAPGTYFVRLEIDGMAHSHPVLVTR